MEMLDKVQGGGGTGRGGRTLRYAAQKDGQFKMYELFTYGIFHFTF